MKVLEYTRELLVARINTDLAPSEREFLISMKRLAPRWELLGFPDLDKMPGPRWKLYNLRKMDAPKREAAEPALRRNLGL